MTCTSVIRIFAKYGNCLVLNSLPKVATFMGLVSFTLLSSSIVNASPATWTFAPSKVGRALHEGGWTVEYSLG